MRSDTISDGLRKYGIGAKLRRLRLRKSLGLLELSRHTGLSPALLDKEQVRPHEHPGMKCFVLSGKLELRTQEATHELEEGDAVYFDCSVPHAYRRVSAEPTTALVVTLPSES